MDGKTLVLIVGAVLCSAAGQLLLKVGARDLASLARVEFMLAAARDVRVLAGILSYAASTVCWLYVLRVAPLSRAYLLSSLTYVLVPMAGVYFFGEQLRHLHWLGAALIIGGVLCLLPGD
jgi:undecaprenyl phosphate-alpha-L-ara4N flippase subunit ArnE